MICEHHSHSYDKAFNFALDKTSKADLDVQSGAAHAHIPSNAIQEKETQGADQHWNYQDKSEWSRMGCSGKRQSPIDIPIKSSSDDQYRNSDDVIREKCFPFLHVAYDQLPRSLHIVNNGHTVVFQYSFSDNSNASEVRIHGGPLPKNEYFVFSAIHFHWGNDSSRGSEHTFDGKQFAMEMHLVHYNSKYGGLQESLSRKDGLAVIAFFFQVLSDDDSSRLTRFVQLLTNAEQQQQQQQKLQHEEIRKHQKVEESSPGANIANVGDGLTIDDPGSVYDLLPDQFWKKPYYKYDGSLTTPLCSETVTWILSAQISHISERQLSVFRVLRFDEDSPMVDNYRDTQPIGDRIISFNNCPMDRR